jgi:hypothetical protein
VAEPIAESMRANFLSDLGNAKHGSEINAYFKSLKDF